MLAPKPPNFIGLEKELFLFNYDCLDSSLLDKLSFIVYSRWIVFDLVYTGEDGLIF